MADLHPLTLGSYAATGKYEQLCALLAAGTHDVNIKDVRPLALRVDMCGGSRKEKIDFASVIERERERERERARERG